MAEKEYIEREALIRYAEKQEVIIKDGTSVSDAMRIQGNAFRRCVETCPTADVVPKSAVERLNAELVRVQARHPFTMTLFELEDCEKHAAIEAVIEVWRELRSQCDAPHWCVWLSEIDDYFEEKTGVKTEDIDELEKKYTED